MKPFDMTRVRACLTTLAMASVAWMPTTYANTPAEQEFAPELGDPESVSIATRRAQPLQSAPAVASVITAEDIQNTGARDLVDILNQVPGIYIGHKANQWAPVFAVRGFTSDFNQNLLLMLDGIPQTQLLFGDRAITLGKIPLDIIERVEVMRGPGSALYGADAFSAVVNIITKKNTPKQSQLALSKGSYDTRDLRGITGHHVGDISLVGAVEYLKTEGDEPQIDADQQTRLDQLMGTHASLAPGNANTHRQELGAYLNATSEHASLGLRASAWRDIGMGIGAGASLDPFGTTDSTTWEALYKYRHGRADSWLFEGTLDTLFLHYKVDHWHFFPPGALGVFSDGVILNTDFHEQFLRPSVTLKYGAFSHHYLTLGLGGEFGKYEQNSESRNYQITDKGIIPLSSTQDTASMPILGESQINRNLLFWYLQDEWGLHPDWTLTSGIRYDHYSDFGSTINPRGALIWNTRHDLTLKFLYGRGFREPSLLETRAQQVPAIRGNAHLNPEILNSFDLAIDYRPRLDLQTRANLFYQVTDNQIRPQRTGGFSYWPENVGKQKGHGVELELKWAITPTTHFYSYYAYQANTDETTGKDAGYTPHHKVFAQVQRQSNPWLVNVQATYIGPRDRIAGDTRSSPQTYTLVDIMTRYDFSDHLGISLDIRNLFDKKAKEAGFGTAFPGDIPLPGRNYYLTLFGRF